VELQALNGLGLALTVDFRKGAEGLAALVRETMKSDPFCGAVYVFRAKRADRVKLIYWDGTGVCLFAKRLEDGKFRWPNVQDGVMRLSAAEFSALLEGLDCGGFTPRAKPRRRCSQVDLRQSESVRSKCSQGAAAHDVITP
jgi:transposase